MSDRCIYFFSILWLTAIVILFNYVFFLGNLGFIISDKDYVENVLSNRYHHVYIRDIKSLLIM